jgi:predicted nucleotidyltransferase
MARGEASQTSDVDIIVRFEKDSHVGLFKHIAITDDLERILKRAVDLR